MHIDTTGAAGRNNQPHLQQRFWLLARSSGKAIYASAAQHIAYQAQDTGCLSASFVADFGLTQVQPKYDVWHMDLLSAACPLPSVRLTITRTHGHWALAGCWNFAGTLGPKERQTSLVPVKQV